MNEKAKQAEGVSRYNKHRRKLNKKNRESYLKKQKSIRETNESRAAEGRGYKGGGKFRGAEDPGVEYPETEE